LALFLREFGIQILQRRRIVQERIFGIDRLVADTVLIRSSTAVPSGNPTVLKFRKAQALPV
jgi:hypothetical protein